MKLRTIMVAAALLAGIGGQGYAQDAQKPSGNVEFIVGAGAGGENDRIARAIQRALQEGGMVSSLTVLNKPGAAQVIAMTELSQRAGDKNTLGLASGSFINAIARSGSDLYKNMTPIMKLFDSPQCFFTKVDSPIKSMKDVQERLKKDPKSISFGFPVGLGSPLHVAAVKLAQTSGVDPQQVKAVVFDAGSDVAAEVAGGHVDVGITSIGSAMPLIQSGQLRFLAIGSDARMVGDLANVPTLKDEGIDLTVLNTFTVVAPPGLDGAQTQYWIKSMNTVLENKTFQEDLARNYWVAAPVRYPESIKWLENEYNDNHEVLRQIGFAQ